jgi:thiaminase/transcriptional activator TenA
MSSSFINELRTNTDTLWQAIHGHAFVRGIGDGTLSRDRFEFYLKQDYPYLIDFSRVLGVTTAKAETVNEMRQLASLLEVTLTREMELHRRTCAELGIEPADLERTETGLITTAYSAFLLRTCYEGCLSDILAALLPCEAGYVEIAHKLREQGLPATPYYRDWIETYTSSEMIAIAEWLTMRLNSLAEDMAETARQRCARLYQTSTRFELLFFDMVWEKTLWPACVTL